MNHERVLYTFKTNIIAMFDLTRYAIPHMPRGSSIINVASVQAFVLSFFSSQKKMIQSEDKEIFSF